MLAVICITGPLQHGAARREAGQETGKPGVEAGGSRSSLLGTGTQRPRGMGVVRRPEGAGEPQGKGRGRAE